MLPMKFVCKNEICWNNKVISSENKLENEAVRAE